MWTLRRNIPRITAPFTFHINSTYKFTAAAIASASLLLGGSLIANDHSSSSLDGVSVDSSIDPFPLGITPRENPEFKSNYKLIASGVRSVTFLSFKVYGVGLYIPKTSEKSLVALMEEFLKKHPEQTPQGILDDKELSQEFVGELSQRVPYAMKVTPVRNTDYGHLRDGLTKSILANPMVKSMREDVNNGIEQLRQAFQGHKGSVPKNDTLWVISDMKNISIVYENKTTKKQKKIGVVSEPTIAKVLMVSYLSNVKPLSEPLRQSFFGYITSQFQ